jgi:hypothetical protein
MAIDVPLDSPSFMDGFHVAEIHNPQFGPVRWTTGNAALPPDLFPPWRGDVLLHLLCGEWTGTAREPPRDGEAALLSAFESLGEDCEFGLLQRRYLVEPPLSLFRWGGAPVARLIEGRDNNFAGLAESDSTDLVWDGAEYFLRTPFVTLHTQCLVEQDEAGQVEILRCGRATLRILRRKLLKDIADGKRISYSRVWIPTFPDPRCTGCAPPCGAIGRPACCVSAWCVSAAPSAARNASLVDCMPATWTDSLSRTGRSTIG